MEEGGGRRKIVDKEVNIGRNEKGKEEEGKIRGREGTVWFGVGKGLLGWW